jgi:argininosuccinate synthase
VNRIILAFSGREASVAALGELRRAGDEVVALTVDIGQADELGAVRERALASGAVRAHVVDARDAFAASYLWAAVRTGVQPVARYSAALALPLLAERLTEIARIERASTVAHEYGGADAGALDALFAACGGGVGVAAPCRSDAREVVESTLWSRPSAEPHGFALTREPADCPGSPASLDIDFHEGLPVGINGIRMTLVELIQSVETIAGAHGIGRLPAAGHQPAVEAPAAVVLEMAFRACEQAALAGRAGSVGHPHAIDLVTIIATGGWFTPAREAIEVSTMKRQPSISGTVAVRLLRGAASIPDVRVRSGAAALLRGAR